jgi:hypothetical protein
MNSNDESSVKITITGDASGALAATTLASAGVSQLRADVAGLHEETRDQMDISRPPAPLEAPPAVPAPVSGALRPLSPDPKDAGLARIPSFPLGTGAAAAPARTIEEAAPFLPLAPRSPHVPTQAASPAAPVSDSPRKTFLTDPKDNVDAENVPALAGKKSLRDDAQTNSRDPASPIPSFNNAVEVRKLHELGRAMQDNSTRLAQMFASLIETQRSSLRLQTSQQAELNALNAQLRTLLAQVGNGRFNTQ